MTDLADSEFLFGMDVSSDRDRRRDAAAASIQQLRSRLLDLTARNPLISFPHGRATGARAHVRAVGGHADVIFAHLADGKPLPVKPLPARPDGHEPDDERDPRFQAALEAARLTDETYLAAEGSADDLGTREGAVLERQLRDRVRAAMGLAPATPTPQTGLADYALQLGIDPSFDLKPTPAAPQQTGHRTAHDVQALALPDVLERQLSRIRDTARTIAEETGVSTLHLAFGFLEWFESEASDRPLVSPLIVMRVDIDREIVRSRYRYSLNPVGDEALVNLTLAERLDRDFRIKLPHLGEDESPESYLDRVRDEVCKDRARWQVRRYVTLAHFPFARLAMFQDLDEAQWPHGLASHDGLATLLGGSEAGPSMFAEEHDVDSPAVAAAVPGLVLEADASQHSAVYDVMCGKNLVIEGPPGTGKSQTIANIIAAALARGRRVLFVADKQAALQVVKDRLDKIGLGDFCLELHSGKARKRDVLDSFEQRMKWPCVPAQGGLLDAKLQELAAVRTALTHYVDVLGSPCGTVGLTVHQVLWADRQRRSGDDVSFRELDEIDLPGAEALSAADLELRRDALRRFEQGLATVRTAGFPSSHPWRGVERADLPSADMARAVRATSDAAHAAGAIMRAAEAMRPLGLADDATMAALGPVASALCGLHVPEAASDAFFTALAVPATRAATEEWLLACGRYRHALDAQQALVSLPGGVAGADAAAALEAGWAAVSGAVPAGSTVGELASFAAGMRAETAHLRALPDAAREAEAAIGATAIRSLADIAQVIALVRLVADAPPSVTDFVTPQLVRAESAASVRTAAASIRRANARGAELAARFSIPPGLEPGILRGHAAALRSAGLFGFLKPAVKAARLCYAGLLRGADASGNAARAAALVELAEHLEAVAAITADQAAQAALGSRFLGLATDIDAALEITGWCARARVALAGAGALGESAAAVLLAGDPDRLRHVRTIAGRPAHATLCARAAAIPASAASLEDVAATRDAQAATIEAFDTLCRSSGVPPHVAAGSIPDIAATLRQAAAAEMAASVPAALRDAFAGHCPLPLDDHAALVCSLALASELAALPLPDAMQHALSAATPDALRHTAVPAAAALADALAAFATAWSGFADLLAVDPAQFAGAPPGALTPFAVAARLDLAVACAGDLPPWIDSLCERQATERLGLGALVRLADQDAGLARLDAAFDRIFHHALARTAFRQHPELERFTGLSQEQARQRFAELDRQATELRRRFLAEDLASRSVPAGIGTGRRSEYTDLALILLEIGKQKRHLPLRQLLDRAAAAAQALKPCLMMSPLSVAQYLKPGRLGFDLLVIDEASQMRPEDALGAVARCGQMVVVGDPEQLPPTSFFARSEAPDDETADEEVDAESILDMAQAVFRPMRRLRWHYRSRHGSLVAFSNKEFYDSDLMVFPSPAEAADDQGVRSVKVDGVYLARSNAAEVAAVCAAAVEHMRTRPERSLGIATMNQVQRELIAQEMDALAASRPEVEAYRERWSQTLEFFFVKNLENVQGDERDFIFVSTVFGPTVLGGRPRQMFGPVNGASGHRRLNVLFTRAKHHVRLFTSLEPEDILAGPDGPRGARVLKAYLAYAKTGRLEAGVETGRPADSDFEVFVRERLRRAGFDAVPQVGVAGYFIDLAVRDPRAPSRFLLGIECDGASYHSSRSARDRDILRQQVLEGLGWTIYRIWSTDWFRDPDGQTTRLVAFIRRMVGADAEVLIE